MTVRRAVFCLLFLLAAPTGAPGDEGAAQTIDLLRPTEMPAHRALMAVATADDTALDPFVTDGCSGGMSAGWSLVPDRFRDLAETEDGTLPWAECCVTHDRVYHDAGGATDPDESYEARLRADLALRACVIETGETRKPEAAERLGLTEAQVDTGYRLLARSMFNAVRLGGGPCSGLPWRWGYGYPNCVPLLR